MNNRKWSEQKWKSWNPVTGCTKISEGCRNCYAKNMAEKFQEMGVKGYEDGFAIKLHPDRLKEPFKNKVPICYFINSMADLFHKDVPFEFIDKVMDVIDKTPHNDYMFLTKRAKRMAEYFQTRPCPINLWPGVTVEYKKAIPRIDFLRQVDAEVRYLCVEPMLEDLGELNLEGIHWIMVGGESAPKARPIKKEWVINLRDQCERKNVIFSFKQWGSFGEDGIRRHKKENGRTLDGKIYDDLPNVKKDLFDF